MTSVSITCPICGAKLANIASANDYRCPFCEFERHPAMMDRNNPTSQTLVMKNIAEISDITLPFVDDLNGYFQEKFKRMKPNELWYLSTPVMRFYHRGTALSGQINYFKAKNIMFLLEQHGFKMVWRKNRFASTLRIIARRC